MSSKLGSAFGALRRVFQRKPKEERVEERHKQAVLKAEAKRVKDRKRNPNTLVARQLAKRREWAAKGGRKSALSGWMSRHDLRCLDIMKVQFSHGNRVDPKKRYQRNSTRRLEQKIRAIAIREAQAAQ